MISLIVGIALLILAFVALLAFIFEDIGRDFFALF